MPKPVQSGGPIRFPSQPEPAAPDPKPKAKSSAPAPLPKAVQALVAQHRKAELDRKPATDGETIARELSRQAGIEARPTPKPRLYPTAPAPAAVSDQAAIARELGRQGRVKVRDAPKPTLRPFPPGTVMPSRPRAAEADCFNQASKTVGTCVGAAVAAGVGTATGPGELVVLGVAGYMCGTEVNDYYRCKTEKR